jgi:hypothetical protein
MIADDNVTGDTLAEGRKALADGRWERACELFQSALSARESADAWEALGWAGWWLAEEELTFRARERAYGLYRAAGDAPGAGRVATWIAADYREFRGEEAVGRGRLERAYRLLDSLPETREHGWLMLTDADFALNVDRDLDAVMVFARTASQLGGRLGVPDLEAVGLGLEGLALVCCGEVEKRNEAPRGILCDCERGGHAAAAFRRLGAVLRALGLRRDRGLPAGHPVVRSDPALHRALGRQTTARRVPHLLRPDPGHKR